MARTPQIHLILKQTMDKYGIKSKDLAAIAGIGTVHLSEVRAGRKWVSPEVFAALLEGMDELAPGSRRFFCDLMAGEQLTNKSTTVGDKAAELVAIANDEDIAKILAAIGNRWKEACKLHSTELLENESKRIPDKVGV